MDAVAALSGERFGRRLRLLDGARFDAVFDYRRRAHSAHFCAHVAPNELGHARLGIAVSKRTAKKATARNRIKRIIRESFRRQRRGLGAVDYVVVAKAGGALVVSDELRAEMERLWSRARDEAEKPPREK